MAGEVGDMMAPVVFTGADKLMLSCDGVAGAVSGVPGADVWLNGAAKVSS